MSAFDHNRNAMNLVDVRITAKASGVAIIATAVVDSYRRDRSNPTQTQVSLTTSPHTDPVVEPTRAFDEDLIRRTLEQWQI